MANYCTFFKDATDSKLAPFEAQTCFSSVFYRRTDQSSIYDNIVVAIPIGVNKNDKFHAINKFCKSYIINGTSNLEDTKLFLKIIRSKFGGIKKVEYKECEYALEYGDDDKRIAYSYFSVIIHTDKSLIKHSDKHLGYKIMLTLLRYLHEGNYKMLLDRTIKAFKSKKFKLDFMSLLVCSHVNKTNFNTGHTFCTIYVTGGYEVSNGNRSKKWYVDENAFSKLDYKKLLSTNSLDRVTNTITASRIPIKNKKISERLYDEFYK